MCSISRTCGFGSDKDENGYIVEVSAGNLANARVLAENGKGGVVLDAPKGMAIHGDTLWICDIDVMRAIDRRTGTALATLDLRRDGALLLNDVTIGGDGAMYITDTGILMTPKGVIHTGSTGYSRCEGARSACWLRGTFSGDPTA